MIMTTAMITRPGGSVHEVEARAHRAPAPDSSARTAELCRQDRHPHRRLQARRRLRHHRAHAGAPSAESPAGQADRHRAEHARRNSIIAANHLYMVAKPDGLTFGT